MTGFYPGSYSPAVIDQLSQRLQVQPTAPAPLPLAPSVNPNLQVNPYYMHAQPTNSLAPMQMYQNYKQTGQMPADTNSFQPMVSRGGMLNTAAPVSQQLQGSK